MMRVALLSIFAAGLLIAGCVPAPAPAPGTESPTTAEPAVRSEMLVSPDWLAGRLDDANLVIVHVGWDRSTYDAGHVPGAHYVDWNEITATRGGPFGLGLIASDLPAGVQPGIPNELPEAAQLVGLVRRLGIDANSRIVIYDDRIGLGAARAYVTFDYLGLGDRTALLDGQWKTWKAQGRPQTFLPPPQRPSSYVPVINLDVVAFLQTVGDLVWQKQHLPGVPVVLIDARPQAQYSGAEAGEGIARPGHIPTAANVFWERTIVSPEQPTFRPPDQMRAIYRDAGLTPGKTAITYCRTGGQASAAYFTCRYLGYRTRIFDGSYFEWSHAGKPIVAGLQRDNVPSPATQPAQ